jgi:hypothetical protein
MMVEETLDEKKRSEGNGDDVNEELIDWEPSRK